MSNPTVLARGAARPRVPGEELPRRAIVGFAIAAGFTALAFAKPLAHLVRFSVDSTLYSHIPLVPIVSAYLIWWDRKRVTLGARSLALALAAVGCAVALLAAEWSAGPTLAEDTSLAMTTASFLLFVVAAAAWFLGRTFLRTALFPMGFLAFAVPLPAPWLTAVETMLQHGSAAVSHAFFVVAGTPVFYEGLSFQLPGITLRVAPECSGIHSTVALLMLSLVAGHIFLRKPMHAAVLALLVLPVALVRNGLRIYTIGELCARWGPEMVDSPLHHRGGPVFFALSLIPFFVALWLLMRLERKQSRGAASSPR